MSDVAPWAGVVVVVVVGGILGLIPLFSDSPSIWINVAEAGIIFFGAGFLIGLLQPRRWWVAGFAAWPGVLLLAAGFISQHQFRDAPVLTVLVGDGYIQIAPHTISASHIRLLQRNEGRQIHEVAIARVEDPDSMDQLRAQEHLDAIEWRFSFQPSAPGKEDVANLGPAVLAPGTYAIGCLRESEAGISHLALGELAFMLVEDKQ